MASQDFRSSGSVESVTLPDRGEGMVSEILERPDGDSEWTVVGERIRIAREAAGISVRELARRIGVSASHVSNVERGLASFSVRALYSVVSNLNISMDSLFEDPVPEHDDATDLSTVVVPLTTEVSALEESGVVLRRADRPSINLGNRRWERLTGKTTQRGTEFLEVRYPPGVEESELPDFLHHQSHEWGVIVRGHLNVQVGFEEAVLHPGDSISFESRVPHRFWNETSEEVVAIWFVLDKECDGLPQAFSHDDRPHIPGGF